MYQLLTYLGTIEAYCIWCHKEAFLMLVEGFILHIIINGFMRDMTLLELLAVVAETRAINIFYYLKFVKEKILKIGQ